MPAKLQSPKLTVSSISGLLLLALFPATGFSSDSPDKLDARLRFLVDGAARKSQAFRAGVGASEWADVFVMGDVDETLLRSEGAEPGTILSELATARVPLARLEALARSPRVLALRAAEPVFPLLDKNRLETSVVELWGGLPPNYPVSGHTGSGVIVGIVDTGIDFTHLDFKNGNNTRILYLWDQTPGSGSPHPVGYTYGQEWTAAQINAGSCNQTDNAGHGTHVAGVAAGNGRATGGGFPAYRYVGMAPEADLIVVKLSGGNDAQVLDAVSYIFGKATALNRDAVVCVAVGKQSGPHDGTDPLNIGIDALSGPGRIVVAAAGNEGKTKIHARLRPAPGQTLSATFTVPAYQIIGSPFIDMEGWFNLGQNITVKIVSPAGFVLGPLTVGQNSSMSNTDGWTLVQWTVPVSGPREIFSTIQNPGAGTWRIEVKNVGTSGAVVDYWLTNFLLSQNKVPIMVQAQNDSVCIASPASATQAIAVSAYCAKRTWVSQSGQNVSYSGAVLNDVADFSSFGPRRDGVMKPDIAASGYGCASSRAAGATFSGTSIVDDGVHVMMTGTSIAAGSAAGAVALLLDASPRLTPASARTILQTRAHKDSYTGVLVPNARWGWGKLSVGTSQTGVADPVTGGAVPMALGDPWPNPVQGSTRLALKLDRPALLDVGVFDVQGREIRVIQSGPMAAGLHTFLWDGRDQAGRDVPSGRYYLTARALPGAEKDSDRASGSPNWLRQSRAVTILR